MEKMLFLSEAVTLYSLTGSRLLWCMCGASHYWPSEVESDKRGKIRVFECKCGRRHFR